MLLLLAPLSDIDFVAIPPQLDTLAAVFRELSTCLLLLLWGAYDLGASYSLCGCSSPVAWKRDHCSSSNQTRDDVPNFGRRLGCVAVLMVSESLSRLALLLREHSGQKERACCRLLAPGSDAARGDWEQVRMIDYPLSRLSLAFVNILSC